MPRQSRKSRRSHCNRRCNRNVYHSRDSKHSINSTAKSMEDNYINKQFRNNLIIPLKKNLTNLLQYSIVKFIITTLNSMQHYIMAPIKSRIAHQEFMEEETTEITPIDRSSSTTPSSHSQSDNYSCDNEESNTSLTISLDPSTPLFDSTCNESDSDYKLSTSSEVNEEIADIFNRASPSLASSSDESDDNIYYDDNENKFKRHSDVEFCHYFMSQQQDEIFNDEYSTEELDNGTKFSSPIEFSDRIAGEYHDYSDDEEDDGIKRTRTTTPIARPRLLQPNKFFALQNDHAAIDNIETTMELRAQHWHDTFALDKLMLHLQVGCQW